jgi:hypothetical protein
VSKPAKASTLKIVNGSEVPVTAVTITAEAKAVGHAGPLSPQAEAVLKLPKLKGCQITVAAALEGGVLSELGAVDVCKVKLVRLTN